MGCWRLAILYRGEICIITVSNLRQKAERPLSKKLKHKKGRLLGSLFYTGYLWCF